MEGPVTESGTARITVSRNAATDVQQRQVIVSVDDGPKATLVFGETVTWEIAPGPHKLKANNTLIWKTVEFTAAADEHVHFVVSNRASKLSLGFLSLMGVAPLYLTIEKRSALE